MHVGYPGPRHVCHTDGSPAERDAAPRYRNARTPYAITHAPAGTPSQIACDFSQTGQPVIKGNISVGAAEHIYHVPGGAFYDATVINESFGERWFCTEREAIAAGWRKSAR